ncbi:MAG: hypothetical protein CL590_04700 [Alteromonadaceae bacterium]|nr:hypothetical protein [Alteromonadaceae bacterium]
MPVSTIKQLKYSTISEHKSLESLYPFNRLLSVDLTRRDYFCVLKILYALHELLDQNISQLPEIQRLQAGVRNTKENLNIDLSNQKPDEVGTNLAVQPVVDIEFRCDSTLIGALYVAEGAKLGARIILRALENRPDKDHLPLQYYKVAAKDSSWKSFGDTIECLTLENKIEADTCVAGAKATFDALIHCAEKMSKHSVT